MKRLVIVLVALLALTACGKPGEMDEEGWTYHGGGASTKLVQIGSHECVLYDNAYAGGIWCAR